MNNFTFDNEATGNNEATGFNGIDKDMLMMMAMSGAMSGTTEAANPMGNPMMMMALMGKGGKLGDKLNSNNPMLKNLLPTQLENCGISFDGSIVVDGAAVKFDEQFNAIITTTEGLQMDMPALAMPVAKIDDIKPGDIVLIDGEFIAVKTVNAETSQVNGLTVSRSEVTNRVISTSQFGGRNVKKVYNPFGTAGEMNPMMALALMA